MKQEISIFPTMLLKKEKIPSVPSSLFILSLVGITDQNLWLQHYLLPNSLEWTACNTENISASKETPKEVTCFS